MLKFIVPYRCTDQPERTHQLQLFLHTMQSFIPDASIVISEQREGAPFNRGGLLNAGAVTCSAEDDCVLCFHDLNVLPTINCIHEYVRPLPTKTVRHLRPIGSHSKLGKIIFMRYSDFQDINGFPNQCWGWRGEDEELHMRILRNGMRIERIDGLLLDLNRLHLAKRMKDQRPANKNSDTDGLAQFDRDGCSVIGCTPHFLHIKVHIKYRIPPTGDI